MFNGTLPRPPETPMIPSWYPSETSWYPPWDPLKRLCEPLECPWDLLEPHEIHWSPLKVPEISLYPFETPLVPFKTPSRPSIRPWDQGVVVLNIVQTIMLNAFLGLLNPRAIPWNFLRPPEIPLLKKGWEGSQGFSWYFRRFQRVSQAIVVSGGFRVVSKRSNSS